MWPPPAPQLLLLLLTVTFFLLARGVKVKGVNEVGGWFGIVTAAVAIYIGFAELFNETAQRVGCLAACLLPPLSRQHH